MWNHLNEDAPLTDSEIVTYIQSWIARYATSKYPDKTELSENEYFDLQSMLYDHIYENLDSLDSKSGALTQAASVVMAVFAIIFQANSTSVSIYVLAGILLSSVSVLLSLNVVAVKWSTASEFANRTFDQALHAGVYRRNFRTRRYRLSRRFLYASFVMLAVYALQFVANQKVTFT